MYLRHTTRVKDGKAHTYWRLVRSVRVGRKVVQQTVAQLGELDAEGRAHARALARTGGRRIEAASLLGMGRNTITRKIQELGIGDAED